MNLRLFGPCGKGLQMIHQTLTAAPISVRHGWPVGVTSGSDFRAVTVAQQSSKRFWFSSGIDGAADAADLKASL